MFCCCSMNFLCSSSVGIWNPFCFSSASFPLLLSVCSLFLHGTFEENVMFNYLYCCFFLMLLISIHIYLYFGIHHLIFVWFGFILFL
ncbi:hypothetical protein GDO86_009692 [Hymenochirus boettgeri]|uniref:Uncharacterized protein n=1 Tax=Hymenochirus boettgeri TaxID=247094 RepID=A0A8T2JH74_9PIPI|nr:hypothetical protein GDO86_009692 [Hymenochirus boettgeri]